MKIEREKGSGIYIYFPIYIYIYMGYSYIYEISKIYCGRLDVDYLAFASFEFLNNKHSLLKSLKIMPQLSKMNP
jgi:hypothetical protein